MTNFNAPLPKEPTPQKVRADAIAILVMGIVASASIVYLAVRKYLSLFVAGGIAWDLPVESQTATAPGLAAYDADGPIVASPVTGTFTHLQVVVPNLNTVSTVCLAISVAAAALTAILVIASIVRLAGLFQQGRFFTLATSRTLRALTWSMIGGGLGAWASWNLGANGIEGALGVRANTSGTFEWWSWYWILLFAVTSSGLIDIALRRAIRLQHETEGLV